MVESQMLEQIDAHSRQWNRGSPFCRAQNFNFIIIIFPGCHPQRSCPWHGWEGRHIPAGIVHAHTSKAQWIHKHAAHTHTQTCSVHKNSRVCKHTNAFDTNIGRRRQKPTHTCNESYTFLHQWMMQDAWLEIQTRYLYRESLLSPTSWLTTHTLYLHFHHLQYLLTAESFTIEHKIAPLSYFFHG